MPFQFSVAPIKSLGCAKLLGFLIAYVFFSGTALSASTSLPQNKVPLLFGENRNERNELMPIPERYMSILHHIEKELGFQFQIQIYPWNRAVNIASSESKLIFGVSQTPDREITFSFSDPALYQYLWLVTRKDKQFHFESVDDLKGKTIGVLRGAKYGGEFDKQRNITFKTDDEIDAYGPRLQKLKSQRIDAMIFSSALGNAKEVEAAVNAIRLPDTLDNESVKYEQFSVLARPVLKDGIRFAILRGTNDKLIADINRALKKLDAKNANEGTSIAKDLKQKK